MRTCTPSVSSTLPSSLASAESRHAGGAATQKEVVEELDCVRERHVAVTADVTAQENLSDRLGLRHSDEDLDGGRADIPGSIRGFDAQLVTTPFEPFNVDCAALTQFPLYAREPLDGLAFEHGAFGVVSACLENNSFFSRQLGSVLRPEDDRVRRLVVDCECSRGGSRPQDAVGCQDPNLRFLAANEHRRGGFQTCFREVHSECGPRLAFVGGKLNAVGERVMVGVGTAPTHLQSLSGAHTRSLQRR